MDNKQVIEEIKRWTPTLLSLGETCTNHTMEAQQKAIKSLEKLDRITSEVNWLCSVKKTEFNYKIAFDSIKKIIWDWSD